MFHCADYAADLFGPPNQVISAVKFVERLYGGDLSNLRQLYLRNVNNPSQKDWQGFNVSCEVSLDSFASGLGVKNIFLQHQN